MSNQNQANKDTFKNTFCYVPFGSVILFIIEKDKSESLKRHISYGMILLFAYIIFSLVFSFLHLPLTGLLGLAYIVASLYLGYMAYRGQDVHIEQFNELEKQIQNKM